MERTDEQGRWVSEDDGETWVLVERTDDDGRWITDDGGVTWMLVEPSPAFIASQTPDPTFPPLDATGALATLLVVEGVVGLQDAANAVHEEPAHLEHEAQAWAL